MRKTPHNSKMWAYLESIDVLNGTEEQIREAKKEYRKKCNLEDKRRQRANKPEFAVKFSKENGEYDTIVAKAKEHNLSVPAFIRQSAFAYLNKIYLSPYRLQIATLEQILSDCLSEIQNIAKQKERFFWDHEQKYQNIEKKLEKLKAEMVQALTQPFTIEEAVKRAIEKNPSLGQTIINIISAHHDRQSKVA